MAKRRGGKKRPRYLGGKDAISFTGRSFIIISYGPKRSDRVVERINEIAEQYAKGRLSKRQYLEKVKNELKKAGLSEKEWKMIYEKIKRKGQV